MLTSASDCGDLDLLEGFEKELFGGVPATAAVGETLPFDFHDYERICVFVSGGKDALACTLHLLDLGVPRAKIELHHHDVDGNGASDLMDWPCTNDYVRKLAAHLAMPVYFSYREGGLEKELLRENCGSSPITFTRGDGTVVTLESDRSKPNTRRKFPQVSASLQTRWCSSHAKISVADRMLINDPRFTEGRTLTITGERAEESANRAKYAAFEPDRADNRGGRVPRWIDRWRPVLRWTERDVWAIIERHRIQWHPCYGIGPWSRCSCRNCVFLGPDAWATNRVIDPVGFERIATYEQEFGYTIDRTRSVREQADRGVVDADMEWAKRAMSKTFDLPMTMNPWVLPKGAYGRNEGPS